jgi:two-component system, chemotaxis family, sensor histidine kinase and response regulator WspE
MSDLSGDTSLIDLFREEVRANTQVLNDGLVALEQGIASPDQLEAMMRAAHSIKGAARVVNVPPAVEVSHAMEDCFVRAQKAELTLTNEVVDVLLAGVDMLQAIAQAAGSEFPAWLESRSGDVAQMVQSLQRVAGQAKAELAPGQTVPTTEKAATSTAVDIPAAPTPAASSSQVEEGVVRVTARSLTRLMALAGESLVEARWLDPFSKSLLQLKRQQTQVVNILEGLQEAAEHRESREQVDGLLIDARQRLAACCELLSHRIEEFDRRVRNTDDLSTRLYREVISSRMRPFRDGVQGLPRLVRDLARQLGKKAQLEILGEATEVDRDILEKLDAPLNHLVRNALDHGLETPDQRQAVGKSEVGRLRIEAVHSAGLLSITISDDGRGIDLDRLRQAVVERGHTDAEMAGKLSDAELLDFLFLPGFSTTSEVTEISGRGVGLDAVHAMVQSVGGHIHVYAQPGRGMRFQLELPITLSVLRAVVVNIAGEPYAFPHNRIDRVIRLAHDDLRSLENRQYFEVDGQNVGIVIARQVLQLNAPEATAEDLIVVLLSRQSARYGVVVDSLLGEQDLVVRPLDRRLGKVPNLHAAAVLDDGSPVLIVDPDDLWSSIDKLLEGHRLQRAGATTAQSERHHRKRVLVVDDSITVREVERQLLTNHGYVVEVAVDGMEGWNLVREGRFDLVVSDIDMPRLNGIELVRKIKADPRLQAIPVVIVSYKDRDEDRLRGLEAGANYYLTKSSFHDDTLIQAVRELIGDVEA